MQGAYERPAIAIRRPVYAQSLFRRFAMAGRHFGKDPRCYCFIDANAVVVTRGALVVWKHTAYLRSADDWRSCQ